MIHRVYKMLNEAQLPTTGNILQTPAGFLFGWGTTVGNGIQGWAPGAIFIDVDGVANENKGTKATADWKTITTAA